MILILIIGLTSLLYALYEYRNVQETYVFKESGGLYNEVVHLWKIKKAQVDKL